MVSPELLRKYELFGVLEPEHVNAIAMLSEERSFEPGANIIEADRPADALYLMMEGSADLLYIGQDEINPKLRKELFISEINPGEPFGISALIEPFVYGKTVRATKSTHVLKVEAAGLRALCEVDPRITAVLMTQVAKAALIRLQHTEVQLGAARV